MKITEFGVESWLNQWEKAAKYDISQSTIDSMTMTELLTMTGDDASLLYNQLSHTKLNYGWIEGSPEFKAEVSHLYDHVQPNQILQTNGATGANYLALYSLIEPGDHVISEYPSYQQLYDIPRSLGAEVDLWHIHEADSWYPDIEELKQLLRPNTKMICLNNANNPTGTLLNRTFLQQVVDLAKTVGAYILIDEVYQPLNETDHFTSIVDLYDRGIATNSLSKTYSFPGIRIGWTAANAEVSDLFRKYRDYTMICGGVWNDILAVYILRHKDQVMARNRKLVLNNLSIFKNWVASEPRVSVVLPQAVSTSCIKLDIPESTEAFCLRLLKETGVLLVPGERFDLPGHARLGYCTDEATLKKGLSKLSDFLRQFD
ncbi:aminotransferase [Secundilactobacillus pentosiphilus]|uniref:Aminotransferase n=1 Tax=Secundilactobacillus pentosiphilus TaxID=1714682 RepID=A0A1Z5IRH9_9LACO|nr:aminotransferase [Secundilactobacillus pentosiphilus]GAX04202.1 aminotransferase [Secundilactobacillus pentosiphilus]